MDRPHLSPATIAVTAGRPEPLPNNPLSPPVTLASTYVARDGAAEAGDLGYGRWANPTWSAFERALGALETGDALAFASGMAATAAVLDLVPHGGVVVLPGNAYNGTLSLLTELAQRGRVTLRRTDGVEVDDVLPVLEGAHLLWTESPTNPLLQVADVAALADAGRAHGALVVTDNTFATPIAQQPLLLGADLVVHSATKYLSGHSDLVLGAVVCREEELHSRLHVHRTLHGAVPGPMETWLALRGLRTLHLRVERACATAAELAARLHGHPAVRRVRHPSLPSDPGHERARAQLRTMGAIVSIELAGGQEAAERLCTHTQVWVDATSLGGVESTLERRRRHAGEPDVVPEDLVRLSVGIEDVEDLWADLAEALGHV
jgi:cystathionine gamma-synthase